MGFIDRLLGRAKPSGSDILKISRAIGAIISDEASRIFHLHIKDLVTKPRDYVISAVWGAAPRGKIDHTQATIQQDMSVLVGQVMERLSLSGIDAVQEFAIEFLVREVVASKIVLMIEVFKNLVYEQMKRPVAESFALEKMELLGRA